MFRQLLPDLASDQCLILRREQFKTVLDAFQSSNWKTKDSSR
jgi:hypothetical protein